MFNVYRNFLLSSGWIIIKSGIVKMKIKIAIKCFVKFNNEKKQQNPTATKKSTTFN